MMQKHKILITLTGGTSAVNSNLQNVNGYSVNNIQGLGNGIVNYSNVRNFLNNDSNLLIINDFFSYLTGATTTVEFSEIYNSDQKLSDVFNNYYDSSIVNNQPPSTSVLDNSLAGTTGVTAVDSSVFNYDGVSPAKGLDYIPLSINGGTRNLKIFSALTTYTLEPSYYIPVFIKRNYSQTDRERVYFENIMSVINESIPDINDNSGDVTDGYGYGGITDGNSTDGSSNDY